jgi:hypothetical protein
MKAMKKIMKPEEIVANAHLNTYLKQHSAEVLKAEKMES